MQESKGELVPGGLAMVIGSVHDDSPYIGCIVELIEPCEHPYGQAWLVSPPAEEPHKDKALAIHLMPIKPEADPLAKEQEKCHSA